MTLVAWLDLVSAVLIDEVDDLLAHVQVLPRAGEPAGGEAAVASHVEDGALADVEKLGDLGERQVVVVGHTVTVHPAAVSRCHSPYSLVSSSNQV